MAAAVILINKKDEILLQHRDNIPTIDCPDYWSLPGGNGEIGEKPTETAVREIKEETGYRVNDNELTLFDTFLYVNRNKKEITQYVFLVNYDEVQKIECLEGKEMRFIGINQIRKIKVVDSHLKIIEKMFEDGKREK